MKKYINRNIVWAKFFVDHLEKLNVKNVVVSPGSRNTPLTYAFAKNSRIKKYVIVDERTAGFFALGLSKKIKEPVAVLTTSGTATAELYPAIIEAYQQRISLIVCTADRPPELLDCGESQTINQQNMYKNHICEYYNAGVPHIVKKSFDKFSEYIIYLLSVAVDTDRGPVHFNLPFRKPFEPDTYTDKINESVLDYVDKVVSKVQECVPTAKDVAFRDLDLVVNLIKDKNDGLIICGSGSYDKAFNKAIVKLANTTKYPIIADGLSAVRYGPHTKKYVIANASAFFRSNIFRRDVRADVILHFGNAPTNKVLLDFFNYSNAKKISINRYGDLKDPSQTVSKIINCDPISFIENVTSNCKNIKRIDEYSWPAKIRKLNKQTKELKIDYLDKTDFKFEGKIAFELIRNLPQYSNLVLSNSTPPRDIDFFGNASRKNIAVFSNRGASGIDGVISTALGIASQSRRHTFLLTGDLAFYYDINALQIGKKYSVPLTIILVDNNGGGIFNMLPIAKHDEIFEEYFTTKLSIDFETIVKGFGAGYKSISNIISFKSELAKEKKGISVLHFKTDSKESFELRKKYWKLVTTKTDKFLSQP